MGTIGTTDHLMMVALVCWLDSGRRVYGVMLTRVV
jgi:hypothetical protein